MFEFPYTRANEAFEEMSAKEKALFIDARLQWATTEMISAEVHIRMTRPQDADEPQQSADEPQQSADEPQQSADEPLT